jgi:hypothetical protein
LGAGEIEQFIESGYAIVRQAFPAELAAEIRALVWKEINLDPDDRSTWKQPTVHLKKFLTGMPFEAVYTPRLRAAIDEVLGAERWILPNRSGWWPIRFPGFDSPPWRPPQTGWHIDGNQFHHHINSPDQGFLGILIFSDIESGDGGTAISVGSHKITARILTEAEPAGLEAGELSKRVVARPRGEVVEITGSPGDVALLHPFMLHSASANTGGRVRIITNKCITLKEPMNLDRADASQYSPVELAIVRALRS